MIINFKLKNFFSIKNKIIFSIVLFVLITTGIIFFTSYQNIKKNDKDDLNIRLSNMVGIAALQIDGSEHSLLKVRDDEETQSYKNIKQVLQNIRNTSTDITYIYTLRENGNGQIEYVVDAEENPEDISHLGDIYDDVNNFFKNSFLEINEPVVEEEFVSDKWGTWVSGYAPFYDKDGRKEGVLGIDVKASDILEKERNILFSYLSYFIISGFLAILLGIFLSRRLIESITILSDVLKNDDHKKIDILPIEDNEIGDLTNVLKNKFKKVDSLQKNNEDVLLQKNIELERINKLMVGRELEMIKLKEEIVRLKNNK